MSLWIDKHRPSSLAKLDYHLDQAEQLKTLISSGDFPHFLVYGPSGAGKKTRIMCILRELYGSGVERLHIEQKAFEAPSGKRLEISILSSNYHMELNPSDVGFYDRVIVQEVIKTMAQTQQLDSGAQKDFKVVILNEADKLSKDAQHSLRRTMEKYSGTCRLMLSCESTSKIIAPIRSRCLLVRVPAPNEKRSELNSCSVCNGGKGGLRWKMRLYTGTSLLYSFENNGCFISDIVTSVCKKEGMKIPAELAERIAVKSNGNLRKALLMAETCTVLQNNVLTADVEIPEPDWEIFLKETATCIVQEQSPKRLLEVRGRFFELLSHCIPPSLIFKKLLCELLHVCDPTLRAELAASCAECEHSMQLGSKPIYHLEAFVAKFMQLYKRYLEATLKDLC